MKRIFEIELIKLRNSRSAKVVFIIYASITIIGLLIFGSFWSAAQNETGNALDGFPPFTFPMVWFTGALISTYLIILPAILAILHAGNEFTYKIHRQHIIDGLSKDEYIISKLFSIFIISLACTIYTIFLCSIVGLLNNSNSVSQEEINKGLDIIFGNTHPILWMFGYFIYSFSILSFASLITFIFRKTGRSIFVFISYFLIVEWILRWLLVVKLELETLAEYLPIWSVSNNIFPNLTEASTTAYRDRGMDGKYAENLLSFDWPDTLMAIIYIGIYFLLIRWIFSKRDL